jgi:hypothetical protein
MKTFKNKKEHEQILERFKDAREKSIKANFSPDYDEVLSDELESKADEAKKEYYDRVPVLTLSVCPFCDAPYRHSLDPYGYDGLWWRSQLGTQEACEHFCVIRNSLNLHGHRTVTVQQIAGQDGTELGPEVPYVIARLLQIPPMVCVVTELKLEAGYTLYPLVYFSSEPVPREQLTARWAGKDFSGYETRTENWDFELEPWVISGNLRWAKAVDDAFVLVDQSEPFPFLDLPGYRGAQLVYKDSYSTFHSPVQNFTQWDGGD